MWFWVWSLLVLGTLAGAFFLGRDLWRKAVALMREVSHATALLGQAAQTVQTRLQEAAAARPSTAPTLFDDPDDLRARLDEVRAERAGRRAQRRIRDEAVWERWRGFNE
ncbi:hypothetical protein [Oerskovia flava]|uniref:hypothetical protein n=1 Tax=Oerskovia flava TaxID=2986422 RepID=UPI002240936A|nr:hypothetical protein [Oerskovia sp. JB1-3-2]